MAIESFLTVDGIHKTVVRPGLVHFATLKFELIDRRVFARRQAARTTIFEYIEVFYNRQRIHETLGYRTPLQVEDTDQAVA